MRRSERGFTLIDVLMLIVLLGVVAGSMTVMYGRMSAQSAEALRNRQVLSVAQTLINEVRMMPFTYCDGAIQAVSAATCGGPLLVDSLGPETGELRYHSNPKAVWFDGVSDYDGLKQPWLDCAGICDLQGNVINPPGSVLDGCSAAIVMAPQAMTNIAAKDAIGRPQTLLISVTVRCPGISDVVLQGIRTRHAPNDF
ncbi:MAG: type II secretion system protein [Pseudomonadota bacterium]